ncbi:5-amino-6-(D-ribitylamino)uracil--L-tyrosine 4-hydroxyphenyl transferase [Streptomyces griseomycini]
MPRWPRPRPTTPRRLTDDEALALLHADGPALDALCSVADDIRKDVVGDDVTYIVTRNINFTNVCYTGCRFCAFAQRRTTTTPTRSRWTRSPTARGT